MHILIAPNAFKNSLSADAAAAAIQRGLTRSALNATSECFPVGDGGDGTGDLLVNQLHGQRIPAAAHDPLGRPIETYFGLIPPSTAIIEMAAASGLRLLALSELNPLRANTAGTGDLILAALDHRTSRIIIAMGGSATVDGATGILRALGARFLNGNGHPLTDLPAGLSGLASIDFLNLDPRLSAVEVIVLCDVANPLTGPRGAAAFFGPQKGASPADVLRLEAGLQRLAEVIVRQTGIDVAAIPRTGTAGGAAAGLYGLLQARLVSGIDYFLEITGFREALDRSTCVITGEGSMDEQTLQGKAPFGVAARAKAKGVPVIALTGQLPADTELLKPWFDELISINPPGASLAQSLADTAANLEESALEWANRFAAASDHSALG